MITSNKVKKYYDNLNKKHQYDIVKFPSNLDTEGHGNMIVFNINVNRGSQYLANGNYRLIRDKNGDFETSNYRKKDSNSLGRKFSDSVIRIAKTIALYMPANISTSYQSNYNETELGVAGRGLQLGMSLDELGMDDVTTALKEGLVNTTTGTLQALSSRLTVPLNVNDAANFVKRGVTNPYMEVIFNGISNRKFSFTFKMIPKNIKEADIIKDIVDTFKFHRAPELKYEETNAYWKYPSEFDIKFLFKDVENPYLFKISTCALTNVSVEYGSDSQYQSFYNGAPFSTTMTLEFLELEVLTKERIEQGY